ncbi:TonB-dependent receptor [Occallatibacter riparius]|uniref:TonB-dependent receptor n=1 Tax=Occallatibacter riparius TaxID=1002689 RepID=A0A9J7BWG1_9BACT|nr:TonB-dependent receptor [Occallatibacter riparius]UWZ86841.1 TonB-dependent receptor [Occallatibacter riparius]
MGSSLHAVAQTSSTGAVTGNTFGPSGSLLPDVMVRFTLRNSDKATSCVSDVNGWFTCPAMAPGIYDLQATGANLDTLSLPGVQVHVAETLRLELHLAMIRLIQTQTVSANPLMLQLDSSALGRTVNHQQTIHLPLATRNFSQLAGLSPGVLTGVYNAGELGAGGTALAQIGPSADGLYVHGSRSYDSNWQLDGISVTDVLGTGSASGGIPIPNPDAIDEFKVQTGQYDAVFGRAAGANVSVITRTGGNSFHGAFFEFVRNEAFNANDYFLNRAGQPRQALKQNQFGAGVGGPIRHRRLFFFGSYQGTRQINGVAAGQSRIACTASLREPPLTNDRSAAALGSLFGGLSGALGGIPISPDGTNINPAALALLNMKLPGGNFLIPNPQTVDPSQPLPSQGFSELSDPCRFNEDQFLANVDLAAPEKDQIALRFFTSQIDQLVTFPGNGFNPVGNTPGFTSPGDSSFFVASVAYTRVMSASHLNEARAGFVRTASSTEAKAPFAWSDIGVAEGGLNNQSQLPSLQVLGSVSMATAFPRTYTQESFTFNDMYTWIGSAHALRFGASLTRLRGPLHYGGINSSVGFLSWPDFLLGLDAAHNGNGTFSNVYTSSDAYGLLDRDLRTWEASFFAQDDYRLNRSLTLNLGLRYERIGQYGDALGRNSSFDVSKADPNPPPNGSVDGYVVGSNFRGTPPPGVIRSDNAFATYGDGQNALAPRVGFAWQIPSGPFSMALRGGYGIYYSRPTGQAFTASVLAPPFGVARIATGPANAQANFSTPFPEPFPTVASFPLFVPYSSTSQSSLNTMDPKFRPALVQQFSLNLQSEVTKGWLLEMGYVGTHGEHLQRFRSLNQALAASPEHPIRGAVFNTIANIGLRVPVPGIRPDGLREIEAAGAFWYNGLEVSLTKRLDHGLQFLGSYTFSKSLDTDGANINGTSAANALTLGDQNSSAQRWGRTSFDRPDRFIFSGTWEIPGSAEGVHGAILSKWRLSAITTIQSGSSLTISNTNANNVFGISEDRAQLSGTCSKGQLVKSGTVESKLTSYFRTECFASPPIFGTDGKGTGFGNSSTGIVNGPGQANLDLEISKVFASGWPQDGSSIELRAEFFNAFNHPQFANPDANFSSQTFGIIDSTAVNPRVGQLALRFRF